MWIHVEFGAFNRVNLQLGGAHELTKYIIYPSMQKSNVNGEIITLPILDNKTKLVSLKSIGHESGLYKAGLRQ